MNILSKINSGSDRSITVKKNILGSLFVKSVSIVISLLLVPVSLGYVSQELYGIWLTLSSVMMMLSFFDIGFSLGLKNKLAEAIALNQLEQGRILVSSTYTMLIVIFIPLCLILQIIIPFIDWPTFLNVNPIYSDEIQKSMIIVISCFCIQMILNTITVIYAAFQKVAISTAFPVIGNLLSLIIIIILAHTSSSSLVLLTFALSVAPVLIIFIATIILFTTKFRNLRPSLHLAKYQQIKELWSLGYKFFLIQIQVVVMFQATNFLISNISGPTEVTSYNISYRYLNVALMLYNIILGPMWPAFTDAYSRRDYKWLNYVYKKMVSVFFISVIIMAIMVCLSPFAYRIWIKNMAEIPWSMTISVFIYMLINTWNNLQTISLNGFGKIKVQTIISISCVIIHIPLSFYLGNLYGGCGVLYSLAILTMFSSIIYYIQVKKILNENSYGIWNE